MSLMFFKVDVADSGGEVFDTRIFVCHKDDLNALNSLDSIARELIQIDEDYEQILKPRLINPVNVSSDSVLSEIVDEKIKG